MGCAYPSPGRTRGYHGSHSRATPDNSTSWATNGIHVGRFYAGHSAWSPLALRGLRGAALAADAGPYSIDTWEDLEPTPC